MLEPIENQYLMIGYINRSHGVKGEVLIISEVFAPTLFEKVDLVYLQNNRGDMVPARVESVRTEQKENRISFFVKFDHVIDRNQAEVLKNFPVYVYREIAEPLLEEFEAPENYTSYKVVDEEGDDVGEVEHTLKNPAHPILQIITKKGRQLLVPFVDEYILSSDEENRIIKCQNLNQLEEL